MAIRERAAIGVRRCVVSGVVSVSVLESEQRRVQAVRAGGCRCRLSRNGLSCR